ncbi:hypothetical protein B6J58_20465 [Klebsiella quasipneumoniae]|nr:hypothetical protein B6J58_20465 [Klebsiella quasipneumoniae]
MRHSGRSDADPLVKYHGAKQRNYLKVKEFNKTSTKSSVTGKEQTFAEHFIDKKAINKNL